ncbi:MAG: hypothetical protein CL908_10890 [Deltaproteobacteria bacterium]|nr:hypothetical protein [Deltaproteobacteria bacterium]
MTEPFRILLMLSQNRDSERVVRAAIEEAVKAREAGKVPEITFAFVHDGRSIDRTRHALRSQGFLGQLATEKVMAALEDEQQRLAMERSIDVQEVARREGLTIRVLSRTGQFKDAIVAFAAEQKYDVIYMPRSQWRGLREMWHEWDPVIRYSREQSNRQ